MLVGVLVVVMLSLSDLAAIAGSSEREGGAAFVSKQPAPHSRVRDAAMMMPFPGLTYVAKFSSYDDHGMPLLSLFCCTTRVGFEKPAFLSALLQEPHQSPAAAV